MDWFCNHHPNGLTARERGDASSRIIRFLCKAMEDKVKNLLVMEDDICFADDFRLEVEGFLRAVPDDWDRA